MMVSNPDQLSTSRRSQHMQIDWQSRHAKEALTRVTPDENLQLDGND